MFMQYRGGRVRHKYMWDIEEKYKNMLQERLHGEQPCHIPSPHQADDENNDCSSDNDEPRDSNQPSTPHSSQPTELATGSHNGEGGDSLDDKLDNEDYMAPSRDNSSSGSDVSGPLPYTDCPGITATGH